MAQTRDVCVHHDEPAPAVFAGYLTEIKQQGWHGWQLVGAAAAGGSCCPYLGQEVENSSAMLHFKHAVTHAGVLAGGCNTVHWNLTDEQKWQVMWLPLSGAARLTLL